jgi:hypothetical protein
VERQVKIRQEQRHEPDPSPMGGMSEAMQEDCAQTGIRDSEPDRGEQADRAGRPGAPVHVRPDPNVTLEERPQWELSVVSGSILRHTCPHHAWG